MKNQKSQEKLRLELIRMNISQTFLLRISIATWPVRLEVVEVFFEEEEGYFPESRMVLLSS
jgi:hypothetical protein